MASKPHPRLGLPPPATNGCVDEGLLSNIQRICSKLPFWLYSGLGLFTVGACNVSYAIFR